MKPIYSFIAVLLVSQSAFSEDSVLFPIRARVDIAGNMLVPGYFCDGMHHTGWPWKPLDYGFAFGDGAPTNSTFIGCCGVHPNNTGPTLNRSVGAGRYGAKVWLEFEGQICNTGLTLWDVPTCFDSFINGFKSISAYSAWEYSSRPNEYDWGIEFRRNTNSTPVAEWQTADDTGIATGSSSRHYSLVADGVSSAVVSKVNVLEQPAYEFVGDSLGCTLLTNGTLLAGTNSGTVHIAAVITSTNICFERDFYFELKEEECETCQDACPIGKVDAHNSSVEVKVSLGSSSSPFGKAFVQVKAETPSITLGTPASLKYRFLRPDIEPLFDSAGDLRQVVARDGYLDILTNSASSYTVALYGPENIGGTDTNGFILFTNPPVKAVTFELVSGDTNHFRVTEDSSIVADYYWQTNGWSLVSGGGARHETEQETVAGDLRTEIQTVQNAAGLVERETTRIWQTNSFGDRLVSEIFGSGSSARTNTFSYYTNGLVKEIVRWNGSWDIYFYDELGRRIEHFTAFLDSPPTTNSSLCRKITYNYDNSVVSGSGDTGIEPYTPRQVTEHIYGTEISRRYNVVKGGERREILCPNPGTSWNATENLVTITYSRTDSLHLGKPSKILHPDGTVTIFTYISAALPGETLVMYDKTIIEKGVPNGTTNSITAGVREELWIDLTGKMALRQTTDVPSQLLWSRERFSYDYEGHLTNTTFLDGTYEVQTYDCCKLVASTDRNGVTESYTHDLLDRVVTISRAGVTSSNVWNSAGDLVATFRIGTNGTVLHVSGSQYGTNGELLATTNALSEVTSYSIDASSAYTIRTTVNRDLSTVVESSARDGTLVGLEGSAVFGHRLTNGVVTLGGVSRMYSDEIKLLTNGVDSSEWVRTVKDALGRPLEVQFPNGATNRYEYDSKGRIRSVTDPDGVTSLIAYDSLGRVEYQAADGNANGQIDLGGTDRVIRFASFVTNGAPYGATVQVQRSYGYAITNSTAETLLSEEVSSYDGLQQWSIRNGLTNYTVRERLGAGSVRDTQQAPDGTRRISAAQDSLVVVSFATNDALGVLRQASYGYDEFNRASSVTDLRNGTTTLGFDALDRIVAVTNPPPSLEEAAQVTLKQYDTLARLEKTQSPDGLWSTNEFYPNGKLFRASGARTYPAEYVYDYAGRMAALKTWQDHGGNAGVATTTWLYDGERGYLTNKVYADSSGPTYTYTAAGRLNTRTWARGITTTYQYDPFGTLAKADYSDATPDVDYDYDRMGHPLRITGATTNDFVVTANGILVSEDVTNPAWNHFSQTRFGYDSLLRRTALTNLTLGSVHTFGYNEASRLASVSFKQPDGDISAQYGYLQGSSLIDRISYFKGEVPKGGSRKIYDYANRVRSITSTNSLGVTNVWLDFGYNAANQVVTRVETDSSYWNYGYDQLGQVTNGWRFLPSGSNVLGQTFNYQFDDIGNRRIAQTGGNHLGDDLRTATYSANLLNQYTNRTVPGAIEVSGAAEGSATVTINGNPAERQDDYFRHEFLADNSSGATSVWLTATATNATATNLIARLEHLPQTPESFTYDADGNLTSDGLRTYTWDAENRLLAVQIRTNVVTDARHWRRVTFDYDHQHRRIRKRAWKWNPAGETYYLSTSHRFFYDHWNLIGQIDEVTGDRMSFLWGADLSGSLRGAGGVGGLVAVVVHRGVQPGTYFSNYDHNGNVVSLIDSQLGVESARYEFGPFGEEIRATGILAMENPFRFSSKYNDEETGLSYYGYRYYSASLGRWLNKDPIEEGGGLNLYGFTHGNPSNYIDTDGRLVVAPAAISTTAGTASSGGSGIVITVIGNGGAATAVTGSAATAEATVLVGSATVVTTAKITLGTALGWGLPTAVAGGALGYGIGHYTGWHDWLGNQLAGPSPSSEPLPLPDHLLGAIATEGQWIDAEGNIRDKTSNEIVRDRFGRVLESSPCPDWKNPHLDGKTPLPGTRGTGVNRAARLEAELIRLTGSGTMDWTPAEIEAIKRTGQLPEGIVGHHINNVADHPEWAGDPRNIQFTRGQPGNLNLHGGSFRKPTVGSLIDRQSMIDRYLK